MPVIYKILSLEDWASMLRDGRLNGAAIDLRDGYVHLSTGAQVRATLSLHFAGQVGLRLLAVDGDRLGDALRWEPSRGGDLFPHLYAPLRLEDVRSVWNVDVSADGRVDLPSDIDEGDIPQG